MKSIRTKFIANMVFLIFLIAVLASGLVIYEKNSKVRGFLLRNSLAFAKGSAVSLYNLYSDTIGESTHKFFQLFKKRFFEIVNESGDVVRVFMVGRNGKIIFDSLDLENKKATAFNLFSYERVFIKQANFLEALQSNEVIVSDLKLDENSQLFLNPFFYKKAPDKILGNIMQIVVPKKEISGDHIISLVYWVTYENIERSIARTVWRIIIISLLFLIVATLIVIYLANWITKPVKNLIEAASKIQKGNLEVEIPIESEDELGLLSCAFNKMSKSLKRERDLLEQRVIERTFELNEANLKLKELDKAKTRFFANISHELRTPLTLILTPLEAIMMGDFGENLSYKDEIFETMKQNSTRLYRLINDLLNLSKLEDGKLLVNKSKIDLKELLEYFHLSIKNAIQGKGLSLDMQIPSDGKYIFADQDLVEKAMFNLISNAMKFTEKGGKIEIGITEEDKYLRIWVKDDGIGIAEDNKKRIFERFERVDEKGKIYEGTGIGLSFVKEIMNVHQGKIELETELKKGSCFTLLFPIFNGEEEKAKKPFNRKTKEDFFVKTESYNLSTEKEDENKDFFTDHKKILIAEDSAEIRRLLKMTLGKYYQLIFAEDGEKAFSLALKEEPDLIITDLMMPKLDGYGLCKKLKSHNFLKHIPVIMISAKSDSSRKMMGFEFGADEYIEKPFHPKTLLSRVYNFIKLVDFQSKVKREIYELKNLFKGNIAENKKIAEQIKIYQRSDQDILKDSCCYYHLTASNKIRFLYFECSQKGILGFLLKTYLILRYKKEEMNIASADAAINFFQSFSDLLPRELDSDISIFVLDLDFEKKKVTFCEWGDIHKIFISDTHLIKIKKEEDGLSQTLFYEKSFELFLLSLEDESAKNVLNEFLDSLKTNEAISHKLKKEFKKNGQSVIGFSTKEC